MKSQAGSTRFDTVLKTLMIAFVSLLAFTSGVFFGRVMSETDRKRMSLEPDFESHGEHHAEKHGDYDQHGETAITAADVEALSEKALSAERAVASDVVAERDGHGHDSHGNSGASKKTEAKAVAASSESELQHRSRKKAAKADDHGSQGHAAPAESGHAKVADSHSKSGDAHRNVASANDVKPIKKELASHSTETEAIKAAPTEKSAKPDMSAVHEAARRVASNENPTVASKPAAESRVPSSLPKTVVTASEINYTVQVASYPTLDEAKRHADTLSSKGFPAFPVEANVKGKSWYRVSVGNFKTQKEATEYRTQLMKQADLGAAIVQKIAR